MMHFWYPELILQVEKITEISEQDHIRKFFLPNYFSDEKFGFFISIFFIKVYKVVNCVVVEFC